MQTLELAETLRNMLADGNYPEQSKLPPERDLCRNLGVTRSSLRKALAILEADGKIWRHVGKGTFVGRPPLEETLQSTLLSKSTNPMEVMEMRLVVEPRLAGFAAIRATPALIARMRRCVDKSKPPIEIHTYELWDAALHRAIAEAAQNTLLLCILDIVNGMRRETLWGQLKEQALTPERMRRYSHQHLRCIEHIEARNVKAAEQTMTDHLELVRNDLLSVHL